MTDTTQPPSDVNDQYFDDVDKEYRELFEQFQQPKKTRSDPTIATGAESVTTTPTTMEETYRRQEAVSSNVFTVVDDIAKDPVVQRASPGASPSSKRKRQEHKLSRLRDTSGQSPSPKRTRLELDVARTQEASVDAPHIQTSSGSLQRHDSFSSQSNEQAAVTPLKSTLEASEVTSLSFPGVANVSVQGFSEWLKGYNIDLRSEDIVAPPTESSFSGRPLSPRQTASFSTPIHTQIDQLANFFNEPRVQYPQAIGTHLEFPSHQQDDVQSSPTNEEMSQQTSQQSQSSTPGLNQQASHGLAAFPSYKEELPAGLTLNQICQDYPNHLKKENLRRFIDAGWDARKIWAALNDSAKIGGTKRRPWNRFEHRILKEKKRMAEEQEAAAEDEADDLPEQGMQDSAGHELPGNIAVPDLLRSSIGSVPSGVLPAHPTRPAPNSRAMFQQLFREEVVGKQSSILSAIMSNDNPRWLSLAQGEKARRVEEEWVRRAKRLERTFAADHDLDADEIPLEPTTTNKMLKRLNVLIMRSYLTQAPQAANTVISRTARMSNEEKELQSYQKQLEILQEWTANWREQLGQLPERTPARITEQLSGSLLPTTSQSAGSGLGEPDAGQEMLDHRPRSLHPTASEPSLLARSPFALHDHAAAQDHAAPPHYRRAAPPGYYQELWGNEVPWRDLHQSPRAGQRATEVQGVEFLASRSTQQYQSGHHLSTPDLGSRSMAPEPRPEHSPQELPGVKWHGKRPEDDM